MEGTRAAQHPYGNTNMHRRFSFSREAVEAIEKGKYHSSANASRDKSPRKAFSSPSMTRNNDSPGCWGDLRSEQQERLQEQATSMVEVEVVPQASGSQSDDVSYMLDIKNHSDRFSDDDSDGSAYSSVCSKDDYSPTPSSAESVTSSSPLLHREPPAGFETLHSDVRDPSLLDRQDKPREGVAIEAQSKLSLDMTARSPLSPKLSGNKLPPGEGDCEDDLPDWLLARTTLSPPASTIKRSARSPRQIEDEIRFAVDSAAARVQQELGRREQFNSELQSAAMWSPTQTTADKQSATSKLFTSSGNDSERCAHVSNDLFDVQGEKEMLSIADHVVASDAEQGDLLLLMEVVIGDGRAETIEIHEGDNPDALALAFAQKHALEPDSVPKLRNLIQEQLHALAEAEPDETLQSELVVEDEWTIDAEFDQYVSVSSHPTTSTPIVPEFSLANDGVNLTEPEHHSSAPERENHREFNYNNLMARYGHYSQHTGKVDPEGRRSVPSDTAAPHTMQIMEHTRTGERVSTPTRVPTFTTTSRSSSAKKKTNLADAPAYERLHALAESKDKWIQRAQKAKELDQVRDEQRLQQVELMAAKSRELVANRTNGNYAHIGERLHDEALSDIAKKVQRHGRRVVERDQQQDWMCPKCAHVNQYNDSRCQNKMAQKSRAHRDRGKSCRETASSTNSSFGLQPEVLCGQSRPERLFQPTLLTTSSSAMKAVNANKEKSSRMASLRRQKHQSAIAEEFQQTCPFKPKINTVSKEIVREKLETAAAAAALNGTRRSRNPHLELYENSFQARVQRQEREEEYFKQFPFKPDIGVNALWVAPDKSQSDFVKRLAVDKYHELERKRVALHDKYAPDRDPRTGKELFKPETGRAPAFSRNKQGLPIGDFLHAAHREQQEYHRQLREKDKREIKKKSQQTFVSKASRQALERRKADTCLRIFNALLAMTRPSEPKPPESGAPIELSNCEEVHEENSEIVLPARVDLSALPVGISRVVAIVFEYANHTPISRDAFSGYIDRLVREVPGVTYSQIIFLAEHLQTEIGGRHRHQFHHSDPEREAALAAAEQKELTFHPVIDKNSREIATKHGRVSGSKVFEALNQYYDHYLERKEQLRKQQQREFKKSHPFHPTLITKTHQREPAATAFYDKIRMGICEDAGNTVSWGATASVSSAPASNRNLGSSIPPPVPLQTALSNARPCIRPIENERSRFYTAATADEPQLEETTRSISRSSSSSQLEDAELTSRVLAALDEKPASTSPTSSYHLTKALSVNDDSTSSADKVCSVRSPEDSALNAVN
ncbi:hypothetical protein PI124_g6493 [Phytophthora idaei]|nr:hypothetical protein PI125_g6182 [Phytophthora idaei]KAG3162448.1 hypothetical protein PI126_g5960 [Phytophthora idaei]KAG3248851.1 hypothetical protein PI124_g6493 [Phytophthora idaei]